MTSLDYLKWRVMRLFRRAKVEVLERVDDILGEFNETVDRLLAAAEAHLREAGKLDQEVARHYHEADRLEREANAAIAEAGRARNVAAKLADFTGRSL